jgi:ABC-type phosphate transport system substrate-binding protein
MGILMRYLLVFLLLSLGLSRVAAADAVVVVANTENAEIKLSLQEIRNLFMGGVLSYDLRAIALPSGSQTRILFNTKVVGLTESRIESYWAQMRFSGRKKQPIELASEALVVEYLQSNPGSIAYLPAEMKIPDGLTVVLIVE